MNVERLEILSNTIRKGYHVFDKEYGLAFCMATLFSKLEGVQETLIRSRPDLLKFKEPLQYTTSIEGFTISLFSDRTILLDYLSGVNDIKSSNLYFEAQTLLDLDQETANNLFFTNLNYLTSGEQMYAVIRSLMITGKLSWSALYDSI